MNERIKSIRKTLKMTQSEFGSHIGIKGNTITNYETGLRNPSDAIIRSICREFNVNEEWLRNGIGEMFVPFTRSERISKFAGSLIKEEDESFKRQLVEALAELDEEEWKVLEGIAKKLSKKDQAQ